MILDRAVVSLPAVLLHFSLDSAHCDPASSALLVLLAPCARHCIPLATIRLMCVGKYFTSHEANEASMLLKRRLMGQDEYFYVGVWCLYDGHFSAYLHPFFGRTLRRLCRPIESASILSIRNTPAQEVAPRRVKLNSRLVSANNWRPCSTGDDQHMQGLDYFLI